MKSKIFNLKFLISIFVILVILGVAITLIVLNGKKANTVVIWLNGEVFETLNLNEDNLVEVRCENDYNIVEIKNGKVRVQSANCMGQDCVLVGYISKTGQTITCLPHKMIVELKRI